jgi:hypothetical protein
MVIFIGVICALILALALSIILFRGLIVLVAFVVASIFAIFAMIIGLIKWILRI